MIIISDTSPISNLIQIQRLDILQSLFQQIIVPPTVHQEIIKLGYFGVDIHFYLDAEWIRIVEPMNILKLQELKMTIDAGESEAIVLAIEMNADYLLMDERLGTKQALREGLTPIGLIGVLLKAKDLQLIPAVKPILEALETIAGFWISEKLKSRILRDTQEL